MALLTIRKLFQRQRVKNDFIFVFAKQRCTIRVGLRRTVHNEILGDAGKHPSKFDDLGSTAQCTLLMPRFCHMHLGTQYKFKVLDGVRVLQLQCECEQYSSYWSTGLP